MFQLSWQCPLIQLGIITHMIFIKSNIYIIFRTRFRIKDYLLYIIKLQDYKERAIFRQ